MRWGLCNRVGKLDLQLPEVESNLTLMWYITCWNSVKYSCASLIVLRHSNASCNTQGKQCLQERNLKRERGGERKGERERGGCKMTTCHPRTSQLIKKLLNCSDYPCFSESKCVPWNPPCAWPSVHYILRHECSIVDQPVKSVNTCGHQNIQNVFDTVKSIQAGWWLSRL